MFSRILSYFFLIMTISGSNAFAQNTVTTVQKKILSDGVLVSTWRFVDEGGREVYFRGFNVSGATKLKETGFKPFKNEKEAKQTFSHLRATTGANIVRFLISWEGVHPAPNVLNTAYLDEVIKQLQAAIDNEIYIVLDYHQDLFSRHLFDKNSKYTGNGAPAWVTPKNEYPAEKCFLCVHWSQNNLSNKATRLAFRNFWNNAGFQSAKGKRYLQDEFLWQMTRTLDYLHTKLTPQQFSYIVGLDPFNEPVDGGMENLTPAQWDQQKLWPFYQRVREKMNQAGWKEKLLFAEPLVFWNVKIAVVRATGGHHFQFPSGKGFVFNSHFYDTARMGIYPFSVSNTGYVADFAEIHEEADYMRAPAFVSEFGMNIDNHLFHDPHVMIHAMYQGLETRTALSSSSRQHFYSPFISATQWHWDRYHDKHHEFENDDPNKLMVQGDAFNGENFSIVTKDGLQFNIDPQLVARIYPRRVQGDLLHFYYNDLAKDRNQNILAWAGISDDHTLYFKNNHFALLTWQEKQGEMPTEIFIPKILNLAKIKIVTADFIVSLSELMKEEATEKYHMFCRPDSQNGGYQLLLWPNAGVGKIKFALIVEDTDLLLPKIGKQLQASLRNIIISRHESPVIF